MGLALRTNGQHDETSEREEVVQAVNQMIFCVIYDMMGGSWTDRLLQVPKGLGSGEEACHQLRKAVLGGVANRLR